MITRFNIDNLLAFMAVAEKRSFVDAANALNLSPSALSRRVQKLEESLDTALLVRTTRDVKLTVAGHQMLARSRSIVASIDSLVSSFDASKQKRQPKLSVSCLPTTAKCFLMPALSRFLATNKSVSIRIVDGTATEAVDSVIKGDVDFGLSYLGFEAPTLDFVEGYVDDFVVVVPNTNHLAYRHSVTWADLAGEDNIGVCKGGGVRLTLDRSIAEHGISIKWSYEAKRTRTALYFVEAGLGVAVVPRCVWLSDNRPDLVAISITEPTVSRALGLIRQKGKELRPLAHELWDLLQAELDRASHSRLVVDRPASGRRGQRVKRGVELTPLDVLSPLAAIT